MDVIWIFLEYGILIWMSEFLILFGVHIAHNCTTAIGLPIINYHFFQI